MTVKSVLVSGASIAGPAVAYWLSRHGFAVTVVEIGPGIRPGGQAVDVRGVAREVIERMGVKPRIVAASVDERGVAFVNADGRHAARMTADAFDGEGIVSEIEIMRGDLTRILCQAAEAQGVQWRFGDRIESMAEEGGQVRVTFARGDTREYDVVIGADGIHSGVRRLAFGPEDQFVRPLGAYTAYFTVPDPGDLDGWFLMHNAPGGKVAAIRPERGGTAKVGLTFTSPPLPYDRRDVDAQQRILRDAFTGVGWRVPEMLAAMSGSDDFYFDTVCQVKVDQWWRSRAALVGDAGYCGSPLTGMGTAMSLVGAYVLAGELAANRGGFTAAFARYQAVMREYVAQCQALPPGGINGFAPRSQAMISMRNLSMRMMSRWPMRNIMAKQFHKADAIALPDYPVPALV
jgi:2-polyprenyl-6-methoxyphenol hydroxylase-like FAD-dependent oxidoreductase